MTSHLMFICTYEWIYHADPTPQDKLAEVDARLSRIEGIVEQLSTRLISVETRLNSLENRQASNFKWLVGIQITTIITLGTLILFKPG